jgi:hypothetical protein
MSQVLGLQYDSVAWQRMAFTGDKAPQIDSETKKRASHRAWLLFTSIRSLKQKLRQLLTYPRLPETAQATARPHLSRECSRILWPELGDMGMGRHVVGRASEIPPGQRRIVEVEGRPIGVFNISGVYYALRNSCPHQ